MLPETKALTTNAVATVSGVAGLLAKWQADVKENLDLVLTILLIISALIGIAAGLRALFSPRKPQ